MFWAGTPASRSLLQLRVWSLQAACARTFFSRATSVLDELESRGLVQAITSRALRQHVNTTDASGQLVPRTVYSGVDPSAASLHVGNLLPLLSLLHFALRGHTALVLVGGATGAIGDPSGRSSERSALAKEQLEANVASISAQVRQFFQNAQAYLHRRKVEPPATQRPVGLDKPAGERVMDGWLDVRIVNNLDWTRYVTMLEFLATVGRHARVSDMLARDSVKNRLAPAEDAADSSSPVGLSFTELSYQLLQAFDFSVLHGAPWNCSIQLGGSDQMGNINAGIDLIRRQRAAQSDAGAPTMREDPAYGLTLPLLLTSTGVKFGKSAGNAVWTSPDLLSDYEYYQFFVRSADADVERYLRTLTLLPHEEIQRIIEQHAEAPAKRFAQTRLAEEMTELVRGCDAVQRAKTATSVLFGTDIEALTLDDVLFAFANDARLVHLPREAWVGADILALAAQTKLVKSKGTPGVACSTTDPQAKDGGLSNRVAAYTSTVPRSLTLVPS